MRFMTSMAGSSWKSADRNGLAPTMSPAETTKVGAELAARSPAMCAARYVAPPARTPSIRPDDPPGGSRLPWKSLMASSCTSIVAGRFEAASAYGARQGPPSEVTARITRTNQRVDRSIDTSPVRLHIDSTQAGSDVEGQMAT